MKNILFICIVVFLSSCTYQKKDAVKDQEESNAQLDASKIENYSNDRIVILLYSIYEDDQQYRLKTGEVAEKYGHNSDEMNALWRTIDSVDAKNLKLVKQILDTKGWLSKDSVGDKGNLALFLVIQHADLATQLAYLPMMREAAKAGNAEASDLALLEDRVAMRQGEHQIYGSQIAIDQETGAYYVSPIVDPENVDKRRAEVGLKPIAEYVARWDIEWDVEEHKKMTAELESN